MELMNEDLMEFEVQGKDEERQEVHNARDGRKVFFLRGGAVGF